MRRKLALDALLFTGACLAVLYILGPTLSNMHHSIVAAVVAGIFALIGSRWKSAWDVASNVESNVQLRIREKKSAVYEEFLVFWFDALLKLTRQNRELTKQKRGNTTLPDHMQEELNKITAKLIPWASTKVIRQYVAFRMIDSSNTELSAKDILLKFEGLMRTIREDIGQSNDDLEPGDLLRLFLTDVDKVLNRTPDPSN